MSRYTVIRGRMDKYNQAAAILPQLQALYAQAQTIVATVELYQAGTDAAFNSAVDDVFSVAERTKLAQIATNLRTLITAWQTNHAAILAENID